MSSPRVELVHRYFWPDTPPYATLLREIAGRLVDAGMSVEVLSAQPSYKPGIVNERRPWTERLDGFDVHRVRATDNSRNLVRAAVGHGSFVALAAARIAFGPRRDVVMCSTVPPVLLASALSLVSKARGAQFIYHCMDLHPDVSISPGKSPSRLQRWLRRIDTATCRRAAAVVVLSEDMKATLCRRDAALAGSIEVINNFDLREVGESSPTQPPPRDDRLRVVFTGNLGRFQGLVEIAEAIAASDLPVELIFMGDGAAAGRLRELQTAVPGGPSITVLPHGSANSARALMSSADLGLVSLVPGVVRSAYPSKTSTYLAERLPLLVMVDDDCELARMVVSEGIGMHVVPGDVGGLVNALREVVQNPGEVDRLRERVVAFEAREIGRDRVLERWVRLIERVASGERRTA